MHRFKLLDDTISPERATPTQPELRLHSQARILVVYGDIWSLAGNYLPSTLTEADVCSLALYGDGAAGGGACTSASRHAQLTRYHALMHLLRPPSPASSCTSASHGAEFFSERAVPFAPARSCRRFRLTTGRRPRSRPHHDRRGAAVASLPSVSSVNSQLFCPSITKISPASSAHPSPPPGCSELLPATSRGGKAMRLAMHYNKATHGFALESVPLGADPAAADSVLHHARCVDVSRRLYTLPAVASRCAGGYEPCLMVCALSVYASPLLRRPFVDRLWGEYAASTSGAAGPPPKMANAAVLLSAGDAVMTGRVASALGLEREQARSGLFGNAGMRFGDRLWPEGIACSVVRPRAVLYPAGGALEPAA